MRKADVDGMVLVGVLGVAGGLLPVAPAEVGVALTLAAALLARQRRRPAPWMLTLGALAFVVSGLRAWGAIRGYEHARAGSTPLVADHRTGPERCSGMARVVGSPVSARGALRWTAALSDLECDDSSAPWAGLASLYGGPANLARGDEVEIVAQLAQPERFWGSATGDPRPSDARRGTLRSGGLVDARIRRRGMGPAAWIDRARAHVRARIDDTFAGDTAAMARALVLGESDLAPEDDAAFRTSGLAHLLAVSGMHLVLVVAGVTRALTAILVRVERLAAKGDVGRVAAAVGIALAWAYADFAGAGGSTLRAAWMMTAALMARAMGRRSSGPRAFGLSLVAMAASDPLVLFDVSFLLSAGATGGLLAFARPLGTGLVTLVRIARAGWVDAVARAGATTLAATIPCAPILARFAPTMPLGGVAANLVAVPLGEACALPLCLLHAMLSPWPAAERGCALAASGALGLVRAVAKAFVREQWLLVHVPPPSSWQLVFVAVGLLALLLPRGRAVAFACCVLATLALELYARRQGAPTGQLRATFLDVGQGDSAIVDLPDGEAIVIDGGGLVGSPLDTGVRVLAPALRERRRTSVRLVILSHPHPDHFLGLRTGLADVKVGEAWDTGQGEREGTRGPYAQWLADLRARGVAVRRPDEVCGTHEIGGARVEVLAPCPGPSPDWGPNDNSFVVRFTFGSRSFLFVGDAEREEESSLMTSATSLTAPVAGTRGGALHADVLKVGHHGSRTSSTPEFLAAVAPTHAIISVGTRNRFGHPSPITLATLRAAHATIWRTDRDGEVTATTDGDHLEVRAAAR